MSKKIEVVWDYTPKSLDIETASNLSTGTLNPGYVCVNRKIGIVPQTFFDWVFCRPKRWKVTSTFIKVES